MSIIYGLSVDPNSIISIRKEGRFLSKPSSPPASLLFKDQATKHTTVKWPIEPEKAMGQKI